MFLNNLTQYHPRLTGRTWTDLLNISSVSAAGYIPQLFSPVFSPDMISSLLVRSGAKALIFDADAFPHIPESSAIPTSPALGADALQRLISLPDAPDRKSTRLNSSHSGESRMPSSA